MRQAVSILAILWRLGMDVARAFLARIGAPLSWRFRRNQER